jgi:spermidine/putrescine-binding protein
MGSSMNPTLRNALWIALLLGSAVFVTGCSGGRGQQLNVLNWSDYVDEDLLKEFEEQTGVKVQYDTFGSDEEVEQKMKTGGTGYDVIFPSDRGLPGLLEEGYLAELDRDLLPNWKNFDPKILGTRHDPKNRFTAPYFWGTLAVGIRTDRVAEPVKGFEVLFDNRYAGRIVMLDDAEHAVAAALLHLGLPMNSTRDEDLARARELLVKQKPLVKAYTDNFKSQLKSGEAWVALGWSGDLLQAAREGAPIRCIVPESGTLIWVDSMAIPKGAPSPKLAHKFINFMLDAKVAARNAKKVRYASPNKAARALMDNSLLNDPVIYPPQKVLDKCQWLDDRGQDIKKIEKIWEAVKQP